MTKLAFQGCALGARFGGRGRRALSSRRATTRSSAATNVEQIPIEEIPASGALPSHWGRPGVYGVYDKGGELQYVAAVTNVQTAIDVHRTVLQDTERVHAVRMITVEDVNSAPLGELAENWVMSHTAATSPPPGNSEVAPEWRIEPEIETGPDLVFRENASDAEMEIQRILRRNRLVLFMKGTSEYPMCGFSRLAVGIVRSIAGDKLKCVDCLDAAQNPGLRDGIKKFSQWPTIPQLYINGDFIGGSDIVQSLAETGELAEKIEVAMAAPAYHGD